jgi:hypothetical protein
MNHHLRFGSGLGCAVLLALTLAGPCAAAAEPSAAVVAKYDKDSDKTLDWNEVEAAAGARFDKLNKDSDGTLDSKEVRGVIGPATFQDADTDHDGTLSKLEYLALVKKRFKEADADNDGTISAKELSSKTGHSLKLLIS